MHTTSVFGVIWLFFVLWAYGGEFTVNLKQKFRDEFAGGVYCTGFRGGRNERRKEEREGEREGKREEGGGRQKGACKKLQMGAITSTLS